VTMTHYLLGEGGLELLCAMNLMGRSVMDAASSADMREFLLRVSLT
jgi:hypothetical protein